MKRIFVGNLPYSATSQELTDLFSKVGKITSVTLITDRYSGQSKGFAFVEMEDDKEALEAITKLNNSDFGNRNIVVSEARPREERPAGGGGGGYQDRRGSGGPRRDFRRDDRRGGGSNRR